MNIIDWILIAIHIYCIIVVCHIILNILLQLGIISRKTKVVDSLYSLLQALTSPATVAVKNFDYNIAHLVIVLFILESIPFVLHKLHIK